MSHSALVARIGFIGAGRVAQTLAAAFLQAGLQVSAVTSRSTSNLEGFRSRCPSVRVSEHPQDIVDSCTLVFLTVSDDAIEPVCGSIEWHDGAAVVHCSGASEVATLDSARKAGSRVGGFHPMQMFANPDVALAGLPGCTVGIEAEGELLTTLHALARTIGCVPLTLPAGVRPLYHASAYYVGPFLIALLKEGANLWKRFGADERQALEAMLPLLRGTVEAVRDGGLAKGMGGCVARGDVGTIAKHLAALDGSDATAGHLYRELAARNVPLGIERGSLSMERAKIIEALLKAAPGSLSKVAWI